MSFRRTRGGSLGAPGVGAAGVPRKAGARKGHVPPAGGLPPPPRLHAGEGRGGGGGVARLVCVFGGLSLLVHVPRLCDLLRLIRLDYFAPFPLTGRRYLYVLLLYEVVCTVRSKRTIKSICLIRCFRARMVFLTVKSSIVIVKNQLWLFCVFTA